MQAARHLQQEAAGFDGAVSGMHLLDLLQVKGMSRFTGRIAVDRGAATGLLFFRDGEVIHAELGTLDGRPAFDAIVVWGDGSFRVEPKVTTTRQTLTDRLQFLLIDAVRLQDELAAGMPQGLPPQSEITQSGRRGDVKERLSGVDGLTDAALTTRQGEVVQSLGPQVAELAASGLFLVGTAERIGEGMGLGPFKGAVIQGQRSHLIVLQGPRNFLFAGATGEVKASVVENGIRQALSGTH